MLGPSGVLAVRGDTRLVDRWASVTKLATALATLVSVEEGVVSLDDPAGPPGSTVRHLLAHASGLAFAGPRALAPPGRRRIYSNAGFEALAEFVAWRTGLPFPVYLAEAVLQPLGMAASRLDGSAARDMVGPLDDLVRLAAELLSPTLVARSTLATATTVAFPGLVGAMPGFSRDDRKAPLDWGLGFEIRDAKRPHWTGLANSPATFGHFGHTGAFLWVDPVARLACVAMGGRDFGAWARDAWPAFSDAVLAEFG